MLHQFQKLLTFCNFDAIVLCAKIYGECRTRLSVFNLLGKILKNKNFRVVCFHLRAFLPFLL